MKTGKFPGAVGVLCLWLGANAFGEATAKYSQVEIDLSAVSVERLAGLGLPVDHHEADVNGILSLPLSQYDLALLRAEKIPYRLLVEDYARHIELRNLRAPKAAAAAAAAQPPPVHFKLGSMGGHLTFAEVVRELDSMRTLFPTLI